VIPLLSAAEVRALDRDASERLGVPGHVLMENAGRGAFDAIVARFPHALRRVVVVGGVGQNGGDGWVVTRLLQAAGYAPTAIVVGDPARIGGDAVGNFAALAKLGVEVGRASEGQLGPLLDVLGSATLVVDALFGIGLVRPLGELHAHVVDAINACAAPVVALDLPSGVHADSGAVLGTAIDADLTVTFGAHKRGLHQHPGAARAGELCCVPIGAAEPSTAAAQLLEASDVAALVPARAAHVHKGDAGHVLVVAGSPGKTGAAALAGLGALRAGAGLVTLAARGAAAAALDAKVLELMTAPLPEAAEPALAEVLALAQGKHAVVVGPGLGLDQAARALCRALALQLPMPAVLDADALTALGEGLGELRSARGPRVLTPHPGEAARLLGCSSAEIQADRYAAANRLAVRSGQVVVLKGARTVIAAPNGELRVCPTGTPAMAVAGTGDVLSGAVATLCCAHAGLQAASAAVYLHGLAGELAAHGDRGLLASELAAALPRAIERCRERARDQSSRN
jgi:NAD(P)H-hydrate epimerase